MTTGWNTDLDEAKKRGTRVLLQLDPERKAFSRHDVLIGRWHHATHRADWLCDDHYWISAVIAWQPLPAPYVPEGGINSDGAGVTQVLKQEGE